MRPGSVFENQQFGVYATGKYMQVISAICDLSRPIRTLISVVVETFPRPQYLLKF